MTQGEDMTFEKVWATIQESDRRWKEEEAQRKKEDDLRRKEAERTMEDLKKTVSEVSRQLGGMGNSNGAEDYFANALSEKKIFAGLQFDEVETNMKGKCGAIKDKFDIVMYNGTSVALIEVKDKAQTEDLEKMVTNKVSNFRTLFPYYAGHRVYLGIGSMSFNDHVYAKAKELGIGMLKQKGDTIEADTGYVRAY
ncbi:hypothetical protein AGMMS49942_14190 [Spirochaetia bacterium]|nr:hypothetical protein AGMMS49942_14190 [Spirochaetia bacterium]